MQDDPEPRATIPSMADGHVQHSATIKNSLAHDDAFCGSAAQAVPLVVRIIRQHSLFDSSLTPRLTRRPSNLAARLLIARPIFMLHGFCGL